MSRLLLSFLMFVCIKSNGLGNLGVHDVDRFSNVNPSDTTHLFNEDSLRLLQIEPIHIIGEKSKSMVGSGQYISIRKIGILNQPNINSVLRTIPGINIRDEEGFGLRPNIGMRGTSVNRCTKITLMEDGILIAPATYADPSAYYFPTFARMHGVEVLKGSSQIKNGPYTIGGAINLLSTPIPDAFKGFAQVTYGSFGTNQQRIWVGDSRENFDYVFEVNRLASDGFKQLDNAGNTGFDRKDIMGKLRWHSKEGAHVPQSITLKFVQSSEVGNESYLGLSYDDFNINPYRRYAATQKDILDMKHQHISLQHTIIPFKNFAVNTTAYYTHTFRDWARVNTIGGQSLNNILSSPGIHQTPYQIMVGQEDGNVDYQSAARTFFSQGIQSYGQFYFNTGSIEHKMQLGVRHHIDQADRYATRSVYTMTSGKMILTNAGILGNQENQIRNATSTATYFSYDLSYKNLKVSPGIRYENIHFNIQNYGNADNGRTGQNLRSAENKISIVLPGIGFHYDISNQMSVFGGIHQGFSPPGMPSTSSSARQADVETAINYELGYKYINERLNVNLTGFYSDYDNILGSDNVSGGGAGTGDIFNAGNAVIKGLELSMDYQIKIEESNLPIQLAYTYTDARFKETFVNAGGDWGSGTIMTQDMIPFITPHLWSGSLGFDHKKFNVILSARYVGATRTKPGQNILILPDDTVLYNDANAIGSFMILDLSANYMTTKHTTLFTTLNNITNDKSIVANLPNGYRPNMPFAFNGGVKVKF